MQIPLNGYNRETAPSPHALRFLISVPAKARILCHATVMPDTPEPQRF